MRSIAIYIILAASIILIGCSSQNEATASVSLSPSPAKPTKMVSLAVPLSTVPPSPTVTTEATATLTPTGSPTAIPTLSPEGAQNTIIELMQNNAGCTQPCFWGIVPGITEPGDAYGYLDTLSKSLPGSTWKKYRDVDSFDFIGTFRIREITELVDVDIGVEMFTTQIMVLTVRASMSGLDDAETINEDWAAFRPDAIINAYGHPSKIKLFVVEGPNARMSYAMLFVYDDEQLIVAYHLGDWSGYAETRLVCPLQDSIIRAFSYWLGEPQEGTPDVNRGYDLAEVSSLTITDFAQLLNEEPSSACFEVNEAILIGE